MSGRISFSNSDQQAYFPYFPTWVHEPFPKGERTRNSMSNALAPSLEKARGTNQNDRKKGKKDWLTNDYRGNIKIGVGGSFFTTYLPIHPANNDLILENPNLLPKCLYSLQLQNHFDSGSLDFFGGMFNSKKRRKYSKFSINNEQNIFNQDLKKSYFLFKPIQKDEPILKTKITKNQSKYSTNVREVRNQYGDFLEFYLTSKKLVEIKMDSSNPRFTDHSLATVNSQNSKKKKESTILVTIDMGTGFRENHPFRKEKINHHFGPKDRRQLIEKRKIQSFQDFPSIFSRNSDSRWLTDQYQYLTDSYWLSSSQLSLCFFLIFLLRKLYKIYQYELGFYLLEFASRLNLYDEDIKGLIDQVYNDGNIRVFHQDSPTSFTDLGGMIELLPKFGETVWYLKNQCRPSFQNDFIPKAILLVGPPGTGKTLLVKAIGSEANVPVLIQSGNGVVEDTDGVTKLQEAFQKARDFSPCILFIDEMDSIGAKRKELELSANQNENHDVADLSFRAEKEIPGRGIFQEKGNSPENSLKQETAQKINALTQLLVEMDGVEKRRGFVVFGATNRRESLDPALIRPGRFNEIIEIGLPNQQKRIEILKIYTNKLGIQDSISWGSLAKRTVGFSAADLATIANRSAIQSILKNQRHTENSLLRGIKETKETHQTLLIRQDIHKKPYLETLLSFLYYEFGRQLIKEKVLTSVISQNGERTSSILDTLVNEENVDFKKFNPDQLFRSFEVSDREKVVEKIKQKIQTFSPSSSDLFLWMIIQLSGKASESLFTNQFIRSPKNYGCPKKGTNLGEIDIFKANLIAEYYSQSVGVLHQGSFTDLSSVYSLWTKKGINHHSGFGENSSMDFSSLVEQQLEDFEKKQLWNIQSIWLNLVGKTIKTPNWSPWFRIHLANPESTLFNEEIIFADSFQQNQKNLVSFSNLTSQLTWDDFLSRFHDTEIQNALSLSFLQGLSMVDESRQELDFLVYGYLKKMK
uniref:Cell division protein n=1 Tax=Marsupiomonas sp. NIES 1824 TaxID=1562198 RepID=A0A097KLS6_9CHLO|nr:cell division protein [Marsupiomonas sp. NIES 1824]